MLKTNWHTHTKRCNHAVGTDEEYVQSAITGGLTTLGFSDHAPYPPVKSSRGRMDYEQLNDYQNSILSLKEEYRGQIDIFCGLEVEYYPEFKEQLCDYRNRFDYLILGQHSTSFNGTSVYELRTPDALDEYVKAIEKACECGLCDYIAHPDVALWDYPAYDDTVVRASKRLAEISLYYNMPLELNAGSGVKYDKKQYQDMLRYAYPTRLFFEEFSKNKCPVIIGLDVHDPKLFQTDLYLDRALSVIEGLDCNILYDFDLVTAAENRKKTFIWR